MGIRKAKVGKAEPGVALPGLPPVDGTDREPVVTEADARDTVIAWLDAHGYAREAETLRRDAAGA